MYVHYYKVQIHEFVLKYKTFDRDNIIVTPDLFVLGGARGSVWVSPCYPCVQRDRGGLSSSKEEMQ